PLRIRVKIMVYAEPIAISWAGFGSSGRVSLFFGFERLACLLWFFHRAVFQDQINAPSLGCPHTEMCLVIRDQFRANWVATFDESHCIVRGHSRLFTIFVFLFKIV